MKYQALFLSLATSAVLAAPQTASPVAATYFMTNNEQGNSIVIHDVFQNGTVRYSGSVPTGGVGAVAQRNPLPPDGLLGQGCVRVSGNRLYNANPGSDTVSMFEINPHEPNQIKLIGKPVNSGGNFPSSVAISSKNGNVCVINGGTINGVQCFKPTAKGLTQLPNTNRLFGLPQTTPPTRNASLYSTTEVLFSRDGSKLIADVKGLAQQSVPGFLAVWDVMADGSLSQTHQTFPAPSNIGQQNFGFTYLNGKEGFVVADPAVGGIIYDFSEGYGPNYKAVNFPLAGQMITCWTSYSSKSNSYFMTDFGTQIIFEVAIDTSTLNTTLINKFQMPLTYVVTDSFVGTLGQNQYLYQLAPQGSTLFVFDIQPEGKTNLIQSYDFSQGLAKDHVNWSLHGLQGMAFLLKQ